MKLYSFDNRTFYSHKKQIREFYNVKEPSNGDINRIEFLILGENPLWIPYSYEEVKEKIIFEFKKSKYELPSENRLERLVNSIFNKLENNFFETIYNSLAENSETKLMKLLEVIDGQSNFNILKSEVGQLDLKSIESELSKLDIISFCNLSYNNFKIYPKKVLNKYYKRIRLEDLNKITRRTDYAKYSMVAIFLWFRQGEIIDNLVDLLIGITHKINIRAERRYEKEILKDIKKVSGKYNILFNLAELSLHNPDGIIKEVLFPAIGEEKLVELVKEYENSGRNYKLKAYSYVKSSYGRHYRQGVRKIINKIAFKSDNLDYKPIIDALELIKKYHDSKHRYFLPSENIPIDGAVKSGQQYLISNQKSNQIEIINYEVLVLQNLRDKLRCKEIWVLDAIKYRNPSQDLPTDFEINRSHYYSMLDLPLNSSLFIKNMKDEMYKNIEKLNNKKTAIQKSK